MKKPKEKDNFILVLWLISLVGGLVNVGVAIMFLGLTYILVEDWKFKNKRKGVKV